ncbi:MAG: hypothetical protein KDB61_05105 [Planctomycetes bacterium]|nr:hypothetical protein [Planctomycetota bacterium]
MPPTHELQQLQDALAKTQGQLAAVELELQRAHRLLDEWELPREMPDSRTGHVIELSLASRLELIPEGDSDEEE